MPLSRVQKKKKIQNAFLVILLISGILAILFRIGAHQTLNLLKKKLTTSIEQNSNLKFHIDNIRLNIFSFIVLEGIKLKDKNDNTFNSESIKIGYSLSEILFKKSDLLNSLRSISIYNFNLTLHDPNITNKIILTRDLTHIKVFLSEGQISTTLKQNNLLLSDINGTLQLKKTNLLFGKFSGQALGKFNKIKIKTEGRLSFNYNLKKTSLDMYDEFHNFLIKNRTFNSLICNINVNTNEIQIKNINGDNTFFGDAHFTFKTKQLKFQAKFQNFALTPYLPNYSVQGNLALYYKEKFSLSTYVSIQNPQKKDKWFLKIENNKILKITRTQNKNKTFVLNRNKAPNILTGLANNMNIQNHILNSKFEIHCFPNYSLLQFHNFIFQDNLLLKKYKIFFYKTSNKIIIQSQDKKLYGVFNKKNLLKSFITLNLDGIEFPIKKKNLTKKLILTGQASLTRKNLLIKNATLHLDEKNFLDFLSIDYNITDSILNFYTAKNNFVFSGLLNIGRKKILLKSFFEYNQVKHKMNISASRLKKRWLTKLYLDGNPFATGYLNHSGNFKQKIAYHSTTPSIKLSGLISGNLHSKNRVKGYLNAQIKKFKSDYLNVPNLSLSLTLKPQYNINFSLVLLDQFNKKLVGDGYFSTNPEPQFSFTFLNKIKIAWTQHKSINVFSSQIDNFSLQNLNGLLNKKYFLQGIVQNNISPKNSLPYWEMEGQIKNFQFNHSLPKLINWHLTYKKKQIILKKLLYTDKNSYIKISKGLFSFTGKKLLFSTLMDYKIENKANLYSGTLQLSGENNSKNIKVRADFINTRLNNFFINSYSQFLKYEKKTKKMDFFNNVAGIQGYIQRGINQSIKSMNLKIITKDREAIKISGSLSQDQNWHLNINPINIDLSYAKYISQSIKLAKGNITGNLRIRGHKSDPHIYGQLNIKNKKLKINTGLKNIRNVQGNILFNGDTSEWNFNAKIDKNPINIKGTLSFQNLNISDYNFDINMQTNDFIYLKSFNDIQGYANLNLNLSKNDEGLFSTSGIIYLKKMDFTFPFTGTFQSSSKNKPVYLDLKIYTLKKVHYFQPASSIDIDIKPNSFLVLSGIFSKTSKDHQLTGKITVEKGSIEYLGTPFDIKKGILTFSDEYDPEIPNLTLYAESKIQKNDIKYTLTLEAKGLLNSDLKPEIYAVPSLTKREILQNLGYGQLYSSIALQGNNQTNEINLETSKEQELDKLFVAGFLTYFDQAYKKILITPVERRIKKILNLDKVEIKSELSKNILTKGLDAKTTDTPIIPTYTVYDALNNSQIVLGKYLTDFLFIEYMLSLRKENYLGIENIIPQHQLGLQLDLKNLTFEWRYEPVLLYDFSNPVANNKLELKWEKPF